MKIWLLLFLVGANHTLRTGTHLSAPHKPQLGIFGVYEDVDTCRKGIAKFRQKLLLQTDSAVVHRVWCVQLKDWPQWGPPASELNTEKVKLR